MFPIDKGSWPSFQTRRALLVVDMQNDFLSPNGHLTVNEAAILEDRVISLVEEFRRAPGTIIWLKCLFEKSRSVNDGDSDSAYIVTSQSIRGRGREKLDGTKTESNEAFLTLQDGQEAQCVVPGTSGSEFTKKVHDAIDTQGDMVFTRTHYSAFRDGSLVRTLRSNLITELFICGSLCNVGVFATALDAAQHGYAITIVDDCLGYRSKENFDETVRRLGEATGCDEISSAALIKTFEASKGAKSAPQIPTKVNMRPQLRSRQSVPKAASTGSVPSAPPATQPATKTDTLPRGPLEIDDSAEDDETPVLLPIRRASQAYRRTASQPSTTSSTGSKPSSASQEKQKNLEKGSVTANSAVEAPVRSARTRRHLRKKSPEAKDRKAEDSLQYPQDETLCEGDTTIIKNLLPEEFASDVFDKVKSEVVWQTMSHQGGEVPRLVAVQGSKTENGDIPIYRHPSDESLQLVDFTPTVAKIRTAVEKALGHTVNHALIQLYRSGTDYISEHSDKTLDITPMTYIANVSLGAQRTMVFRTKSKANNSSSLQTKSDAETIVPSRTTCRAALPHNSLCKMGLVTNMRWLHAIRQDKRLDRDKSKEELAFDAARISITFRSISTFLTPGQDKIWGQGATQKKREGAADVLSGPSKISDELIKAFGVENQSTEFDWNATYGQGFDVLHLSNSCKLYESGNAAWDLSIKMFLKQLGVKWVPGKLTQGDSSKGSPRFVDSDHSRSVVEGFFAILLYIYDVYHPSDIKRAEKARQYTLFEQTRNLDSTNVESLEDWSANIQPEGFIAGASFSMADAAFWPVLDRAIQRLRKDELKSNRLVKYHDRVQKQFQELCEAAD